MYHWQGHIHLVGVLRSSTLTPALCVSCPAVPVLRPQLASGEVFGKNQPIALQLLGSSRSREALEGVAMELEDSLYPLLREVGMGLRGGGGDWTGVDFD